MTGDRATTAAPPLAATLERLSAARSGGAATVLSAHPGVPEEPGWVYATDLPADPDLLDWVMARLAAAYGAGAGEDRAFAGTSVLRSYLWRLLVPAVAAILTERRAPDLRVTNVALRFDERGSADLAFAGPGLAALPDDPEAGHPDVAVLPSEEALLAWVRDALAGTHLPAMIPALRSLGVRRGKRALWRVAADSCADAFLYVGLDLGQEDDALRLARPMLDAGSPLAGPTNFRVLEHAGGVETTRVRGACCLYYKLGHEACFTCPRITDQERLTRLARQA